MTSSSSYHGRSFNKRLDPSQLDIDDNDTSCCAEVTRTITQFVSRIFKPRQVIVLLRLLKALTFCTLILTIIADLMFCFYVEFHVSRDVSIKLGGHRETLNRLYGVSLAVLAVFVELDMHIVNKHFVGLKPFVARSILYLFVASLSSVSPMIAYERRLIRQYRKQSRNYNYDYYGDDKYGYMNNNYNQNSNCAVEYPIKNELPGSATAFQSITSFVLFGCACAYMLLGLLCLDRFTAKAFLADEDQVAAAVSATQLRDVVPHESFDSYDQEDMSYSQNHNSYIPSGSYRAPNGEYSDRD